MLIDERQAIDLLNELAIINEALSPLEKRKREVTEQLKQYMTLNDQIELRDGEHGITGIMQQRTKTPTYNLERASDEAVVQAARHMLLSLDHSSFQRMLAREGDTWMEEIDGLKMPGGITEALVLVRDK